MSRGTTYSILFYFPGVRTWGPGLKLTYCGSGYNPPQFVIDAAKEALDRVECNQYSPTKVCVCVCVCVCCRFKLDP